MAVTFDQEKIEQFRKPMVYLIFSMVENANKTFFLRFHLVHFFPKKSPALQFIYFYKKHIFRHCYPTVYASF